MANRDAQTLLVVHEVSQTASRLAHRMGGIYVLDGKWREALEREDRPTPQLAVAASA